jgi:IclR family transcriptional regulator, acetate operon repressor
MAKALSDGEKGREPEPTRIQSVARAARVLVWLAGRDGVTATEVALAHGIAVPTAHHLLNTLVAEGLLAKDSRRRYALGPKVAVLADAHLRQTAPPEHMLEGLRALAAETGETAYLAAWRGDEIRALASVEGTSAVRVGEITPGRYRHAHARATGKLLLAYADPARRDAYLRADPIEPLTEHTIADRARLDDELATIRDRGYAIDEEEFQEGVSCCAAPILENGVAIATFTVSAPSERFDRRRDELVAATRRHARAARSAAERVADPDPHPPEAA